MSLSPADLARLAAVGISRDEAERQLALLASPPPPARLLRPCQAGDGILRLDETTAEGLLSAAAKAAADGRLAKFVPASGAASRMFADLLAFLTDPTADRARAAAAKVAARLDELALRPLLAAAAAEVGKPLEQVLADGDLAALVAALVSPSGLGLAARPKGLLPFHLYPEGPRTAFVEHLVEGAAYLADRQGRCRLHFTVSPGTEDAFSAELAEAARTLGARLGVSFDVDLSHQEPATDTLALDGEGQPFRDASGALLRRPGGHGALLGNLARTRGELVVVKNIDNVLPERAQAEVIRWQRLLVGLAAKLTARRDELFHRLGAAGRSAAHSADDSARREAVALLAELGHPETAASATATPDAATLRARLDRPLRICGVVANTGEPGGGPFWVAAPDGSASRQLVESAQVDLADAEQSALWRSATHFNPVQLVCALDGPSGRRYDLDRFVDPAAVFLARKSEGGRELVALERPGLWNGAMAHWHTVFVEVPVATFAPVKTLLDLARPEHRVLPVPPVGSVASPGGRGYDRSDS